MKRIAVLTSGGDAPGMNACIRAIVLAAHHFGLEVFGYKHGYNGLLDQEYIQLNPSLVSNIIQCGGTILKSARCPSFATEESGHKAAENLRKNHIDALLIIGGDGSFRGAMHLAEFWPGQIIGLPGTIDNDIDGTDATIGYYTAIETALEAIDKVRDTADAFERIFLIEVMGRHSGFIGLNAAIGSGAEQVLLPELEYGPQLELENIIRHVESARKKQGNCSYIVVVTENLWPGGATDLASTITQQTGIECRPVVLGYIQRGGSPVSQDRILATKLGAAAVEAALAGKSLIMMGEQNHSVAESPLVTSWLKQKKLDPYLVRIQQDIFDPYKNP